MSLILEIGPGTASGRSINFDSAMTVDPYSEGSDDKSEWGQQSFSFEDDCFSLVFASHVLEHVPWYRTDSAIKEVHRILKSGGEFEVYVPDFDYIVQSYLKKTCGDKWRVFNAKSDWMTWVNGRIFTYGQDAVELVSPERPLLGTHHKAVFNEEFLVSKLYDAGFSSVTPLKSRRNGKAHSIPEVGAIAVK